jgi:hypothetical protein
MKPPYLAASFFQGNRMWASTQIHHFIGGVFCIIVVT